MIRAYTDDDYKAVKELYQHTEWYGGVFDEARDGQFRMARKSAMDPESIFVYEQDGQLIGTVSIIDDGRVGMLFRLVVKDNDPVITKELYSCATKILQSRGHQQVLVYTPVNDQTLHARYKQLGMQRGGDYTCYWVELK